MAFDFTELPTAIRKTWDAVVPPLSELALAAAVIIYLVGWRSANDAVAAALTPSRLLPSASMRPILNFYGVASLIPLAVLIGFLVLAHAVGRLVRWTGRLVPGYLVPNTTEQIYGVIDEWDLRRIWACHPDLDDVDGLNALNIIIDEEVARAATNPKGHHRLKSVAESQQFARRFKERVDFAKGLFIIAGLSWLLTPAIINGSPRPTDRVGITLVILMAWIFWNAVRYISAEQELARFKVYAYLGAKGSSLRGGGEPNPDDWERDRERIEILKQSQLKGEVWSFHLLRPGRRTSATRQLLVAFWRFASRSIFGLTKMVSARSKSFLGKRKIT
jgi:hypothetical protein